MRTAHSDRLCNSQSKFEKYDLRLLQFALSAMIPGEFEPHEDRDTSKVLLASPTWPL